jgi:ApaG protein
MPDTSIHTSEASTNGVRVTVTSRFSHTEAEQQRWFFTYTVRIANEGTDTVQLVSRHWIITNGSDEVEEVKGLGVVGHQPTLGPGQAFEYTSGCPLSTPFGSMRGTYQMVLRDGSRFDAEIAEFALTEPYTVH